MKTLLKGVVLPLTLISFSILIWGIINQSIVLCNIGATLMVGNFFLQIYIDHGVINLTNIKRDLMFNIQKVQSFIGGPPTPIQVKSVENLIRIIRKEQCKKINIYVWSRYLAIAQISGLNGKEYKLDFYITIENKKRIIYSLLLFKRTEDTRTLVGMEANLKAEKKLQQEGYKIMKIIINIFPEIPVKIFDADGNEIEEESLVQK